MLNTVAKVMPEHLYPDVRVQKTTAFLSTDLHGKKFDYYPQQKSVKLRLLFLSFLYI